MAEAAEHNEPINQNTIKYLYQATQKYGSPVEPTQTTQKSFYNTRFRVEDEKAGNVFLATLAQRPHEIQLPVKSDRSPFKMYRDEISEKKPSIFASRQINGSVDGKSDDDEALTTWQRLRLKELNSNMDQDSLALLAYHIMDNEQNFVGSSHCTSGNFLIRAGLIIIIMFISLQTILSAAGTNENVDTHAAILSMVPADLHKFLTPRPQNVTDNLPLGLNGTLTGTNTTQNNKLTLNISDIKRNIAEYNLQQTVYNVDVFGPLGNDSVVIVVQVHNRITYLRHLIVSLAQASGISQALIVFSHDYYDEEINHLVQSVDFCKTIQIFYPHSIQTHPHEFPGEDPNDCPRDLDMKQAITKKCNNALYPDRYGHYREAKFTQTKHHWWWKANRVFDQLEITRNHSGLVVFFEEDHYVVEDFIYVLNLMEWTCKKSFKRCNFFSLNAHLRRFYNKYWFYGDTKEVLITRGFSREHNMGLAFNRSTWMGILGCADYFCKHDDYNWDWSLERVLEVCLKQKFRTMAITGPRVFHIGECGVHHNKDNCESTVQTFKVQQMLKTAKKFLYPDYLALSFPLLKIELKISYGNGGWGDRRDYKLCMNMTL